MAPRDTGGRRTPQVGKDTNGFVYTRLAPDVFEELERSSPMLSPGYRRKNITSGSFRNSDTRSSRNTWRASWRS